MQGAPTALALQAEALVWSLDRQPERPRSRNPSCKGRAGADSGAAKWGGGGCAGPAGRREERRCARFHVGCSAYVCGAQAVPWAERDSGNEQGGIMADRLRKRLLGMANRMGCLFGTMPEADGMARSRFHRLVRREGGGG